MRRKKITFPYPFSKNGRSGKVYKTKTGIFKTHFIYAHKTYQNTFSTLEKALEHLDSEFDKLDSDTSNSQSQFPLTRSKKDYWELEQRLKLESDGASLWEAVNFFLTFHKRKAFKPLPVKACVEKFIASTLSNGATKLQIRTLNRHCGHFIRSFGSRKMHTLEAQEIAEWLDTSKDPKKGNLWSSKTKKNTRGTLVSLGNYSATILKAIPLTGEPTEFEKVPTPKVRNQTEVEIYTPEEFKNLLFTAIEHDVEFLPILVLGGLVGLRPSEAHGEDVDRPKLTWDAIDWEEGVLHVRNQKVRTKRPRDILIQKSAIQWLLPFKPQQGVIWKWKTAHDGRFSALRSAAGVRAIQDGLRHSYASYRIKQLTGNIEALAEEMGNSPEEITRSYKRGVSMAESTKWFGIIPPRGYGEKITAALNLRQRG